MLIMIMYKFELIKLIKLIKLKLEKFLSLAIL